MLTLIVVSQRVCSQEVPREVKDWRGQGTGEDVKYYLSLASGTITIQLSKRAKLFVTLEPNSERPLNA